MCYTACLILLHSNFALPEQACNFVSCNQTILHIHVLSCHCVLPSPTHSGYCHIGMCCLVVSNPLEVMLCVLEILFIMNCCSNEVTALLWRWTMPVGMPVAMRVQCRQCGKRSSNCQALVHVDTLLLGGLTGVH